MLWATMLTPPVPLLLLLLLLETGGTWAAISALRRAARSAMEDEGGTVAVITVAPWAVRASWMPCQ